MALVWILNLLIAIAALAIGIYVLVDYKPSETVVPTNIVVKEASDQVVYISGAGDNSNDGLSDTTPVLTFARALAIVRIQSEESLWQGTVQIQCVGSDVIDVDVDIVLDGVPSVSEIKVLGVEPEVEAVAVMVSNVPSFTRGAQRLITVDSNVVLSTYTFIRASVSGKADFVTPIIFESANSFHCMRDLHVGSDIAFLSLPTGLNCDQKNIHQSSTTSVSISHVVFTGAIGIIRLFGTTCTSCIFSTYYVLETRASLVDCLSDFSGSTCNIDGANNFVDGCITLGVVVLTGPLNTITDTYMTNLDAIGAAHSSLDSCSVTNVLTGSPIVLRQGSTNVSIQESYIGAPATNAICTISGVSTGFLRGCSLVTEGVGVTYLFDISDGSSVVGYLLTGLVAASSALISMENGCDARLEIEDVLSANITADSQIGSGTASTITTPYPSNPMTVLTSSVVTEFCTLGYSNGGS